MLSEEDLYAYKNGWFACAVTRGYEMRVYNEIRDLVYDEEWGKYIRDVFVMIEEYTDAKGVKKERILQSYKGIIYINMLLTQDVYNVIKVDGFRTPLPAKEPLPIPRNQMEKVLKMRVMTKQEKEED